MEKLDKSYPIAAMKTHLRIKKLNSIKKWQENIRRMAVGTIQYCWMKKGKESDGKTSYSTVVLGTLEVFHSNTRFCSVKYYKTVYAYNMTARCVELGENQSTVKREEDYYGNPKLYSDAVCVTCLGGE